MSLIRSQLIAQKIALARRTQLLCAEEEREPRIELTAAERRGPSGARLR